MFCSAGTRALRLSFPEEQRMIAEMKLFYTGPFVNADLLIVMLEKHGIIAAQEFVDCAAADEGDLNRLTKVLVPEAEYDRAYRLFYAERQDEL